MDKTYGEVDPRFETHGTIGEEFTRGSEALQSALRKGAVAIGHGLHDRTDEVIAYTRRQPVGALTAAAGLGLIVGVCLALSARSGERDRGSWFPGSTARRSYLGRSAGPGWRSFLGLE
jgi:hypothetical protein